MKKIIRAWPWPLTLNERYDRQTRAIIRKVCVSHSICIDIGSFKGDILQYMIEAAPDARPIAFEPIPGQFQYLKSHFGEKATIYPYALGNTNTTTTFNFVRSNPTYSGLQQRLYKRKEEIETIQVEVKKLDDVISGELPIRLIKIDVEGGEFDVMLGARQTLEKWHPYIIFEHGIGGTDRYGVSPGDVYEYLNAMGYHITLMQEFLAGDKPNGFSKEDFENQFHQQLNCYFLAY
ncbi:MAG TPA: FkbM family methyltransferase [Saprospiraceae bacterium]|nr:FkbM family methyltransferase [Saprospiraceae bacterium]